MGIISRGIRAAPGRVVVQRSVRLVARPRLVKPLRVVSNPDWMEVSYFVGKSVILFTMFYSGLNWLHYKKVREDNEKKK